MTASPSIPNRPICPYLRAPDGWRGIAPSREHRCSAVTPPVRLAGEKQARLCLLEAHESCATYQAALTARSAGGLTPDPDRRPLARTIATVVEPAQPRFALKIGNSRLEQGAIAVLMIAAVLAVVIARGQGADPVVQPTSAVVSAAPSSGADASGAPVLPSPSASAADPVSTPTPEPMATPRATSRPTAQPTPAPTPRPTARPTAAASVTPTFVSYTVKSGDTLYSIAVVYGTTIEAIVAANGITSKDFIVIGQVLRIPR